MKGIEFRCRREYLGLTAGWLAQQMGVYVRTVQRWEEKTGDIPPKAEQAMTYLCAGAARAVSTIAVEQIKLKANLKEGEPLPPLMIPAGADEQLPASWHRMIAVRVAERTGQEIVSA
jgi:hypothetical protein